MRCIPFTLLTILVALKFLLLKMVIDLKSYDLKNII